jgi:hypothetical protein
MSQVRKGLAVAASFAGVAAAVAVAVAMFAPSASAARLVCPRDGVPAAGSTVTGGIEVNGGACRLDNITVYGGITVDPTPESAGFDVNFARVGFASTVNGGIRVDHGSLLGVDIVYATGEVNASSTINGGITANDAFGLDIEFATVTGGVTLNGTEDYSFLCGSPEDGCFQTTTICGDNIFGNVSISTPPGADQNFLGDPGEQFFANANCDANTIHGSVFLTNSNFLNPFDGESNEIEGNTVTGSVHVDHSTAEVYGNTVGGSLLCTNGSVIQPPAPDDPSGSTNNVNGANTCF